MCLDAHFCFPYENWSWIWIITLTCCSDRCRSRSSFATAISEVDRMMQDVIAVQWASVSGSDSYWKLNHTEQIIFYPLGFAVVWCWQNNAQVRNLKWFTCANVYGPGW